MTGGASSRLGLMLAAGTFSHADRYSYIASTEVIGPFRQIHPPSEPVLVEGAKPISGGTNIIQFTPSPRYAKSYGQSPVPKILSLTQLAQEPSYRREFAKWTAALKHPVRGEETTCSPCH